MAKRDYYDVLGVNKSASADQIKAAYRKLAVKHHPDKNKGDKTSEEKFKEASEAYHILSNTERKQNYDNLDTLHLRMVEVEEEDLVILIFQITSQIYLRISLEILVEVVEGQEKQTLEGLTLDMIYLFLLRKRSMGKNKT